MISKKIVPILIVWCATVLCTLEKFEYISECILHHRGPMFGATFVCSSDRNKTVFHNNTVRCSKIQSPGTNTSDNKYATRDEHPGTINFKDCRFTELPTYDFFKIFYNMHSFIISNVDLNVITSETFMQATNVTYLTLSQNRLQEIPAHAFVNAQRLRNLDLSQNLINRIDSAAFVGLKNLTLLDLSINALTTFDENVLQELPSLNFLNLSYNQINQMDSNLLHLPSLLELDLAHNGLTAINHHVFNHLENLQVPNSSSIH